MTSSLLIGPQATLEDRLLEAIQGARADDPLAPIYVVVPSSRLTVWLRRSLGDRSDGLINVRFLTFVGLARELSAAGADRLPLAGRTFELVAIREALVAHKGYFESISDQSGLHVALLDTLQDLDNAAIDWDSLDRLGAQRGAQAGELAESDAARLRGLATIGRAKAQRLGENFQTPRGLIQAAESAVGAWAAAQPGPVFVYGFHDFTELQARVLGRLAAASNTTVFMADEQSGGSTYLLPSIERLEQSGFRAERLEAGNSAAQNLAAALFSGPAVQEAPVSFMSAPSELIEVQEVVRQLITLLEAGVSPDEIAIVHHGAPYPRLLAEVLERSGLEYFLASGELLSETRYGKSLLLLLDLAGSPMRRMDVMEFVSFAPLRPAVGSRTGNWEWITRRAAIVEGEALWKDRLDAYAAELERELQHAAEIAEERAWLPGLITDTRELRSFASNLFDDLSALVNERSWSGHVDQVLSVADRYLKVESDTALKCVDALAQLRDLDRVSGSQPFEVFRDVLEQHFSDQAIQHGRLGRGNIYLGRPRDLRGMRYEHLFVVGLAERSFPPPPSVDSVLLERERRTLARSTGSLVHGRAQALNEERLLFANLLGSAGRSYLSFPRFEMEKARPRFASPFFLAVAEAMTGKSQDWQLSELPGHRRVPDTQPDPALPVGTALCVEEVDLSVVMSSPSPGPREWSYLDHSSPHFRRLRNAVRCRSYSRLFTRYDGLLRKDESRERAAAYLQGRLMSPTALETYATCPQRFFMKNVMRVEVLDEPENVGELSPLERGTVIHDILQRFYEELKGRQDLPLERSRAAEYRELLEKIALAEFARAEERGVTGHLVGWRAYRRRLLEDLVRFLENELDNLSPDLVPSQFEFEFGHSADCPPVVIGAENGFNLSFGGRIDRIDAGEDRARVVDYKSGKTLQSRYKDNVSFAGGEQLQLPIYLLATAQALNLPAESVDAAYYHINRQVQFRTVNLKGDNFAKRRGDFNYLVAGLADHIQRGIFVPQTKGGDNCRYCDFQTTCPAAVQRQQERKQEDEKLASFLELKDIK